MAEKMWTSRDEYEYGGPLSGLLIIQAKRRQDEGCERALSRMGLLNACIAVDGTPCTALHTNNLMEGEKTLGSSYLCLLNSYLIHDAPRLG